MTPEEMREAAKTFQVLADKSIGGSDRLSVTNYAVAALSSTMASFTAEICERLDKLIQEGSIERTLREHEERQAEAFGRAWGTFEEKLWAKPPDGEDALGRKKATEPPKDPEDL